MLKTVYAIAAAAIVAASFVGTLSLSPEVEARGSLPGVKADRADTRPLAKDCSKQACPISNPPACAIRAIRMVRLARCA